MKPQPEARVMGGDDAIMMGWRDPAVAGQAPYLFPGIRHQQHRNPVESNRNATVTRILGPIRIPEWWL